MKNTVNEIEIKYRNQISENKKILSSDDAVNYLREVVGDHQNVREVFIALYLNAQHKIIGHFVVSMGGITATVVDPKMVFSVALKCLARSVILCHNHPSGNIYPSDQDKQITKKLVEGGKLLEIVVLDHVILTEDAHYSFADEGIL